MFRRAKSSLEIGEMAVEIIFKWMREHLESPLAAVAMIALEIKRFTPPRLPISAAAEIAAIAPILSR